MNLKLWKSNREVLNMLILTRRISETINVGDNIKFTVLAIKGHQVRIGIDAPEEVLINREEVHLRLQQAKAEQEKLAANN
jgi:carbon storage regulator